MAGSKTERTITLSLLITATLVGLYWWQHQTRQRPTVDLVAAAPEPSSEQGSPPSSEAIVVDVAGAVVAPGVYTLAVGDRVEDAIKAAGGLADNAAPELLPISRAARLVDEQKIVVPVRPPPGEPEVAAALPSEPAAAPAGCISLNAATQSELESLVGIGPVRAKAIIDARPYASVEALQQKSVIPQGVFEDIQADVCP